MSSAYEAALVSRRAGHYASAIALLLHAAEHQGDARAAVELAALCHARSEPHAAHRWLKEALAAHEPGAEALQLLWDPHSDVEAQEAIMERLAPDDPLHCVLEARLAVDTTSRFEALIGAARSGHIMAQHHLAKMYLGALNTKQALQWLEQAAQQGCIESMLMVAPMLFDASASTVRPDWGKGAYWLLCAAAPTPIHGRLNSPTVGHRPQRMRELYRYGHALRRIPWLFARVPAPLCANAEHVYVQGTCMVRTRLLAWLACNRNRRGLGRDLGMLIARCAWRERFFYAWDPADGIIERYI